VLSQSPLVSYITDPIQARPLSCLLLSYRSALSKSGSMNKDPSSSTSLLSASSFATSALSKSGSAPLQRQKTSSSTSIQLYCHSAIKVSSTYEQRPSSSTSLLLLPPPRESGSHLNRPVALPLPCLFYFRHKKSAIKSGSSWKYILFILWLRRWMFFGYSHYHRQKNRITPWHIFFTQPHLLWNSLYRLLQDQWFVSLMVILRYTCDQDDYHYSVYGINVNISCEALVKQLGICTGVGGCLWIQASFQLPRVWFRTCFCRYAMEIKTQLSKHTHSHRQGIQQDFERLWCWPVTQHLHILNCRVRSGATLPLLNFHWEYHWEV
jgi:hypothetical protein